MVSPFGLFVIVGVKFPALEILTAGLPNVTVALPVLLVIVIV